MNNPIDQYIQLNHPIVWMYMKREEQKEHKRLLEFSTNKAYNGLNESHQTTNK